MNGDCVYPEVVTSKMMKRAQKIQDDLPPGSPTFAKLMRPSHVTSVFWLSIPSKFCASHLPKYSSETITLECENGKEYETKFISTRKGLCGGWKRFSVANNLVEGDVVVFHLVEPLRFKVHIVRSTEFTEVDGTVSVHNLDHNPLMDIEEHRDVGGGGVNNQSSFVDFEQFKNHLRYSEGIYTELVKKVIPKYYPELAEDGISKYYELCCAQKSFLHHDLVWKFLHHRLAASKIAETVLIANKIRSCNERTSPYTIEIWDKNLEALERSGMEVGFIRRRLVKAAYWSCTLSKKRSRIRGW